jgi:nicotinamidase-related amidase
MAEKYENTALLVMDVQSHIVSRIEDQETYLATVNLAVAAAHENHLPVIYVVVGFRPGFPEVSSRNKSFSTIKETSGTAMLDPQPVIELTADDIVVTKRRVSAFSGSDLEVILRAQGIKHLVLAGIATSGVVLSTVREAADKDFQLSVLADACADFDSEVHQVLLEKVFPRQATVLTSADWISETQKEGDV